MGPPPVPQATTPFSSTSRARAPAQAATMQHQLRPLVQPALSSVYLASCTRQQPPAASWELSRVSGRRQQVSVGGCGSARCWLTVCLLPRLQAQRARAAAHRQAGGLQLGRWLVACVCGAACCLAHSLPAGLAPPQHRPTTPSHTNTQQGAGIPSAAAVRAGVLVCACAACPGTRVCPLLATCWLLARRPTVGGPLTTARQCWCCWLVCERAATPAGSWRKPVSTRGRSRRRPQQRVSQHWARMLCQEGRVCVGVAAPHPLP